MEIENLAKEIRQMAFERKEPKPPEQVGASWYNDDLTYNGVAKTLFIILPTPGCAWALGDSGGCTMCSYVSQYIRSFLDSQRNVTKHIDICTSIHRLRASQQLLMYKQ